MTSSETATLASPSRQADLIYDVGMHQGEDTHFYLKKGFRVVAFEANPQLAAECTERFAAEIAAGLLTICEGAIVPANSPAHGQGFVTFYLNTESSVWGTVSEAFVERNVHLGTESKPIQVPCTDFDGALQRFGIPYYMKIDIEGVDHACSESLAGVAVRPRYLSIEAEKMTWSGLRAQLDQLVQLGYQKFAAVQQATIESQQPPNPCREGKQVPYRFEFGSSGLFGRELPTRWYSVSEFEPQLRRIMFLNQWFGDRSWLRLYRPGRLFIGLLQKIFRRPLPGWYDIHASLTVDD